MSNKSETIHSAYYNQLNDSNGIYNPDTDWTPIPITEHTGKLYQLDYYDGNEVSISNFFIDEDTYKKYLRTDPETDEEYFDVKSFCNDAQIAPYVVDGTYKNHISCYNIPEESIVNGEFGKARNNPQYGETAFDQSIANNELRYLLGGIPQFYIPDEELDKLECDDTFISPTIRDVDRDVGLKKTSEMIAKGRVANDKAHDELLRLPAGESEMQELGNEADEIKANSLTNTTETLEATADQAQLPATRQTNSQSNEQTQSLTIQGVYNER